MTDSMDKLTPGQLRDLAYFASLHNLHGLAASFREEAARREAEAKPEGEWQTLVDPETGCPYRVPPEAPAPSDDLVAVLRQNVGSQYQALHDKTADRIEAQAREIADLKRIIDGDTASLEAVEADNARLREALKGLLDCPAIADGDFNNVEFGCGESAAAESRARMALAAGGNRG